MVKYIVNENATIRDALIALNDVAHDVQSLFIVDVNRKMVGSLTDGDIRRGLISGSHLDDSVKSIMHQDVKFVKEKNFDILLLKQFRNKGILFIPVLDEDHHIVDVINLRKYKSRLPIDVILMAGGKGERLRPLTEKTPKPLLPVGCKCIIDHNVDRLISYGINHINVTVNYLHEQIESHFENEHNGVLVRTFLEPTFLGTMGSARFVDKFFHNTILVMNSDLFTNIDYEDFFLHHVSSDADMTVAAIPYDVNVPYGILDLEGSCVRNVIEKPCYNYYANAGIYLIKKEFLDEIPKDRLFNATDLIEMLISKNRKVIYYPMNETWIDIGSPQEYHRAIDIERHMKW